MPMNGIFQKLFAVGSILYSLRDLLKIRNVDVFVETSLDCGQRAIDKTSFKATFVSKIFYCPSIHRF